MEKLSKWVAATGLPEQDDRAVTSVMQGLTRRTANRAGVMLA
jgi:hypothetical protein